MSLFPAYSSVQSSDIPLPATSVPDVTPLPTESWLSNPSFEDARLAQSSSPRTAATNSSTEAIEVIIDSDDQQQQPIPAQGTKRPKHKTTDANASDDSSTSKRRHRHKSSKKKKRRHERGDRSPSPAVTEPTIEFTGREEYYVDKKWERGYLSVQALHRPACPKYRTHSRPLAPLPGRGNNNATNQRQHRYYAKSKLNRAAKNADGQNENNDNNAAAAPHRLTEDEFIRANRDFNQHLSQAPGDIDAWLRFVRHQELSPQRLSKLQLAERKTDILQRAIHENMMSASGEDQQQQQQQRDRLYAEYAAVIEHAHPSFEVSKMLGRLLTRDATNYTLWHAQILATQGSMARCVVPDVLKLYEQCMKHMFNRSRYDAVMLKLFTHCCFFLRQSGLAEQLFAVVKLTLDLNVRNGHFARIQPSEADQPVLVEYEEVILGSGLPMNEIWLRIEKLRQNYNFLPCPEDRTCSDPQRFVYNEDIVHFVFPLTQRAEHVFDLVMRVLHVLKVPMPVRRPHEHGAHFDAIEDVLDVLLCGTLVDCSAFDAALCELVRDFSSGPTFVRTHLGHEIYTGVQTEVLLLCAEAMTAPEQRRILEWLWLRFERIQVRLERQLRGNITGGDDADAKERAKKLRSRVKNLLKRPENRNEMRFYIEYAALELELGEPTKSEAILCATIAQSGYESLAIAERSEVAHVCVALAEQRMRSRRFDGAVAVLAALALGDPLPLSEHSADVPIAEYKKLQAIQQLSEQSRVCIAAEREISSMPLEQHFAADPTVTWAKAKVYMLLMVRTKRAACDELDTLLRSVPEDNKRHRFLRERLYEVYADVVQFADRHGNESNRLVFDVLQRGLGEFADNLVLVRFAAMLQGQTWFRIRTLLTRIPSAVSIVFLVAAAKFRYARYNDTANAAVARTEFAALSSDIDANELTFKTRVCNLLRNCCSIQQSPELRRNALLWRIYLRSLVDVGRTTFEESRDALFAALDECPWNKALYLDGSVYAPQQVTHIQDLIIEKQLRICALPEELEILRSDDPLAKPTTDRTSASLANIIKSEPV